MTPAIFFGAAYYPEHRDPSKWEYDLGQMARAHVNCLRVGEFAWSRFEPEDGGYDFEWMERFADLAVKREIRLLLCPPLRTLPSWLASKDPGLAIEREDGVVLEYGSRYSFCINHPLLREKGRALATAMSRHFAPHPAVAGWHLDNEHGDEPDCHCPICRKAFQSWCRQRYGTIEQLNECWGLAFWGLRFNDWIQIPTPRVSKTYPSPGHLQAWRRFRSDCTIAAAKLQADAVREHARPDQFITTNHQTWNPRTDYFEMDEHLDISGTNYYPPYGEATRNAYFGLAAARGYKQQTFQVHELRNSAHMIPGEKGNQPAPGEVARLTFHCVANGADGIFYFRWRACPFGCEQFHGTITDYDGRPRRIFAEIAETGKRLRALAPRLKGSTVEASIALLYDFPSRWMSETGVRWNGPSDLYMGRIKLLHDVVRRLGYGCDAVSLKQEWDRYRVLIVPMLPVIDDENARKLTRYVAEGGIVLWHPLSGTRDTEGQVYPNRSHPGILKLAGVDVQEYITLAKDETVPFNWNGKSYQSALFCDTPVPAGADTQARFVGHWIAGTPAITRKQTGQGAFVYVMTFAEEAFYRDFLPDLFQKAGVSPVLETTIPEELEVAARRNQNGERLIFLINHNAHPAKIDLPRTFEDAEGHSALSGELVLKPHETRILAASDR